MIDVLFISPAQFFAKPQVGTSKKLAWCNLADWLAEPAWGESKDGVGGWSPCLYKDNIRRKANVIHACALVVDVDAGGDVDALAEEFQLFDAILHETFSSTAETPRCRVVLRLAEPISAEEYEHLHRIVRRRLREDLKIGVDDGAKDVSRFSYSPVRRPGSGYRFRVTNGKPLDAAKVIAAHPPLVRALPAPRFEPPKDMTRYHESALRKAADALAAGTPGERHDILCREAYSLARLDLTLGEIARALMPAALHSMGEHRRREIERTIAESVQARRRAS